MEPLFLIEKETSGHSEVITNNINPKETRLLTIAIPTFNRNAILIKNLEGILPQVEEWVEIVIIDNGSTESVLDAVFPLLSRYKHVQCKIIKNRQNIGGNSNILRCIEYANAEYIWILGDDDFPKKNALRIIYEKICNRKPLWVNFYSKDEFQPVRSSYREEKNLYGFLRNINSISELVFSSNNIFRLQLINSGIECGYKYNYMMAPHLISMISGLTQREWDGNYIICLDELFLSTSNNRDSATSWPLYMAFIGIFSIYKIPFKKLVSNELIRLVRGSREKWLNNKSMIYGFSRLSSEYGPCRAFMCSLDFPLSIIIIDKFKSPITLSIFFISIFCGANILKLNDFWKYKGLKN